MDIIIFISPRDKFMNKDFQLNITCCVKYLHRCLARHFNMVQFLRIKSSEIQGICTFRTWNKSFGSTEEFLGSPCYTTHIGCAHFECLND